jgi:hypothetical protein
VRLLPPQTPQDRYLKGLVRLTRTSSGVSSGAPASNSLRSLAASPFFTALLTVCASGSGAPFRRAARIARLRHSGDDPLRYMHPLHAICLSFYRAPAGAESPYSCPAMLPLYGICLHAKHNFLACQIVQLGLRLAAELADAYLLGGSSALSPAAPTPGGRERGATAGRRADLEPRHAS